MALRVEIRAALPSPTGKTPTVMLNGEDTPGVMAAAIAHEYERSTQTMAGTYTGHAENELRAWDAQMLVGFTMDHQPTVFYYAQERKGLDATASLDTVRVEV